MNVRACGYFVFNQNFLLFMHLRHEKYGVRSILNRMKVDKGYTIWFMPVFESSAWAA